MTRPPRPRQTPAPSDSQGGFACEQERRRFARRYCGLDVSLRVAGTLPAFPRQAAAKTARLADFSRNGICLACVEEFYPCEILELDFPEMGQRRLVVRRCRRQRDGLFHVGCELLEA